MHAQDFQEPKEDIIWTILFLVTLMCVFLDNWCFVQIVSCLVLESLVHAYLLYVYLMACLLSLIQYIGQNSIKS